MRFAKFFGKRRVIVTGLLAFGLALSIGSSSAWAGGPRFISGNGLAVPPGTAEGWNTTLLQYFTDPGDLSASVSHAQSDAMVAAAATVWNVPTSNLALAQGGQLAEHVSGANSFFGSNDFIFPSDVQTSNEENIPVAVLYDTDGSLTELLLGSGASDPSGCRQNGVTASVDDIQSDGHIHHALLILNGRCVGAAPEQLTQMQYQVARAFGRILGLSWSQNNDNVFTGTPQPNADQAANWPLMHPMDVVCGYYSYQCMLNPFTLRADDLSSLETLYTVLASEISPGKQASDQSADFFYVISSFPNTQGMGALNFSTVRQNYGVTDDYQLVSAVTGVYYQASVVSPVSGTQAVNQGDPQEYKEGLALTRVVPIEGVTNVFFYSEPINPLYTGDYAIGPYVHSPSTPSGSTQVWTNWLPHLVPDFAQGGYSSAPDAAASCNPGNDGTEGSPAALSTSGWQTGQLCGWGHNSWWSATVKAGRSWTLETTATDEAGRATIGKAEPVMGVWNAADPTGTVPTLASGAVPFNALALGVTQVRMDAAASDAAVRFVVGDEFGMGRPDFTYTTRLLYADGVQPLSVGSGGGTITITGTGFKSGNAVQINGVAAAVQSWTDTQIVVFAPSAQVAGMLPGTAADVSVIDLQTGGETTIFAALTYTYAPDLLQVVTKPPFLTTDATAAVPFAVEVLASDGVTPVAGATVQFALTSGSASLGACGSANSCNLVTDSQGIAQSSLIGSALGTLTITATEISGGATVQLSLTDVSPVQSASFLPTAVYVAAGASGTWVPTLIAYLTGVPTSGVAATWTAGPGVALQSSQAVTGPNGGATATLTLGPIASGAVLTVNACAWGSQCATWSLFGVDPSQLQFGIVSGAGQSVPASASLGALNLMVTDNIGHPVQDATVSVHQRVLGWESPCSTPGRCAAAPVLASTETVAISGADGSLSFQPLEVAGIAQTVEIAMTFGTQGFLTINLVKTP